MSENLTIKDLWVVVGNDQFEEGVLVATEERPVTPADLVAVLRSLPETQITEVQAHFNKDGEWDWECIPVFGCPTGRYLVYGPLGEETE